MTAPLPDAVGVVVAKLTATGPARAGCPLNNPDGPEAANLIQSQAARIAELEASLMRYGEHGAWCSVQDHPDYKCDCGFAAATHDIKARQARSLLSEGEGK